MLRNSFLFAFIAALAMGCSCSSEKADVLHVAPPEPDVFAYGYKLNDLQVFRDTVRRGDTFTDIFLENGFSYTDIYNISRKVIKTYNFRKIKPKKAYTFLFSKDSLASPVAFIYQPSMLDYVVVNLKDSVYAKKKKKGC
ncbi:MAG: hypothetical protein CMC24_01540 [Flavobacteriaceae bacterium]|nr:hypothetical protein [Flavobacteriaceae bacterium]